MGFVTRCLVLIQVVMITLKLTGFDHYSTCAPWHLVFFPTYYLALFLVVGYLLNKGERQ